MNSAENNQDDLTSADEVAEPPSGPVRRSPGGMLMAQRETLELSLQQVADQLHLTMHFVRAIESDSYDKLPGDVFVRGYIRTYARLLRLDPDQVLMIYDEFNSHKMARKEEAIKRRDRRRKDKNRPWVIVSGIAFVSVAVALWYLNPGQPSDIVADAASDIAALEFEAAAGDVVATETTGLTTDNQISAPALQTGSDNSQLISASEPVDSLAESVDSASSDGEIASDVTSPAELSMKPAASGRTIMEYWNGADELRIGFREESAVQVEHSGGSEAHEHIHTAGETLVIRGTAPFSVLLGDARNVSLSFNGRQIDISSNIRVDNSARLSIGM
ncbi:MAG: DUF4115 domain-containing protein [Gammaproteobacteria bacterium]|nr:DUF4115 domain-containing protein [Gammaproteobacteria bacterium]